MIEPTGKNLIRAAGASHRFSRCPIASNAVRRGFRPTDDEVEWERGRTQSDAHLLGLLLLPVYAVDRTGKRHRAWVRRRLGVAWEPVRVRAVAEAAMREALLRKDNPADVISVAVQALMERYYRSHRST